MVDILTPIQQFFDIFLAALGAASFAAFFWGLVLYITEGGDEAERLHAKRLILLSTTGLLLVMIAWGLLSWLHLTGPQFAL